MVAYFECIGLVRTPIDLNRQFIDFAWEFHRFGANFYWKIINLAKESIEFGKESALILVRKSIYSDGKFIGLARQSIDLVCRSTGLVEKFIDLGSEIR